MNKCCIFLHGLGLSSNIWEPVIRMLECETFAPDLMGHGNAPNGSYDFSSLWLELENTLPRNRLESSILVLHSMATGLLPEIARQNIRPSALILIEGNLISEDLEWSKKIYSMSSEDFEKWIIRFRQNAPTILRTKLKKNHPISDLIKWSEGFRMVDANALREIAKNLITVTKSNSISMAIQNLDIPTYYLRGELSKDWNDGYHLLNALSIPVIKIPNSAHYPMLDNPTEIQKFIMFNSGSKSIEM